MNMNFEEMDKLKKIENLNIDTINYIAYRLDNILEGLDFKIGAKFKKNFFELAKEFERLGICRVTYTYTKFDGQPKDYKHIVYMDILGKQRIIHIEY